MTAGPLTGISLPAEILAGARELPYAPDLYFDTPGAVMLPLALLHLSRARPAGIANGLLRMAEARMGVRPKRAPIDIRPRGEGSYDVIDGNSTACVAFAAGWPDVPCRIMGARHDAPLTEITQ